MLAEWIARVRRIKYLPLKYSIDLLAWTLSGPIAFALRLEEASWYYLRDILIYTLLSAVLKGMLIYWPGIYRQSWHKAGVKDLYDLGRVIGFATLLLLSAAFLLYPEVSIPRSVPLMDGGLAVLLLGGMRLMVRLNHEQQARRRTTKPARRVLIVGAGEAGTMIAREMFRHPESGLTPIGYLDDEPAKRRERHAGLAVLGGISSLPEVVAEVQPHEILIAMPSAPGEVIRQVVSMARQTGVRYRIMPGMYDILSEKVSINEIREVDVEDLLRREPVRLDMDEIANTLKDRVVLVTGAGGSIGSEIVRQVIRFEPRHMILLDRDENSLYLFERELQRSHPGLKFEIRLADIQRREKLELIFEEHHPQVVFHAAAHKHVPVVELSPDEAILNNVGGTGTLIETCAKFGVERFINISTDKAISPTSVMGASKRVAEYLVRKAAFGAKTGQSFVSVRFGNVLGSSGSVVPIFKDQIRRGGPVTVTHPDMMRYFMSIPEAVQLVLQAAALGENGAVYILDMGKPVKIVDLARDLIQLSGLEPDVDILIEFTGVRPGEKLFEELLTAEEGTLATKHKKIFTVRNLNGVHGDFNQRLDQLLAAARAADFDKIREMLRAIIPTYTPDPHGAQNGAKEEAELAVPEAEAVSDKL
jgi:FlaA1/EpsC-like NDP-sugar epimerase